MKERAAVIIALAFGILVLSVSSDAQQPGKVARIGFLGNTPPTTPEGRHLLDAFLQGLRERGYVEGKNVAIEYRWAEGKLDRLPELAAQLIRLKPDVIVATGMPAPLALKHATATIPIVMAAAGDPVGSGLVDSLARPGGNITGLSILTPELGGKRLQLLKEVVPGIFRVAVLWNAGNPYAALVVREIEVAARTLGVQLQSLELRGPDDFDGAFGVAIRGRAAAVITVEDPLTVAYRARVVDFASKNRLPAMYGVREFVDAGGLMAYGPSLSDLFRRSATYVEKILKGAKPADLPVEQPTKFEFIINLKTAKALGLTIPRSILIRADEVIQ